MSKTSYYFNSTFKNQTPSKGSDITPLTSEQMERIKAGFDDDTHDESDESEADNNNDDPVEGELGGELTDG